MEFTVILISLLLQRVLNIDATAYQYNWFGHYYAYVHRYLAKLPLWSGFGGVALIIVPGLLVASIVYALVFHVLGVIGYYLLNLILLWYCLDAKQLSHSNQQWTARNFLMEYYQRIFALLFWYVILGLFGVTLYILSINLREFLQTAEKSGTTADHSLLKPTIKVIGVLDWVPLRLVELTFALMGHFGPTFKLWCQRLPVGINAGREELVHCALVALDLPYDADHLLDAEKLAMLEQLINRILWAWVVVIALYTIGAWVG